MKRSLPFWMAAIASLSCSHPLWGANSVTVESKTVVAGSRGVEVGIYISNVPPLAIIELPLEIREVTPGSFITDSFIVQKSNRLLHVFPVSSSIQYCAEHSDTFPCWYENAPLNFVSPEMFNFFGAGWTPSNPCMPSGTDGSPSTGDIVPPVDAPSLILRFDVTEVPGVFVIDSTCFGWEKMRFATCDLNNVFTPAFSAGVITIVPCGCDCHGDPQCDGEADILDVMAIIGEAFGSASAILDDNCGRKTRGDINCDCQVDIADVVGMIDVALRGKDPSTAICNGCSNNCP